MWQKWTNETKNGRKQEIKRWGLDLNEIEGLGERIGDFWHRYRFRTQTQTRDTSEYGYHYLSSILRMKSGRTIAEISRVAGVPIQNMHHYISKSPWPGDKVIKQARLDIAMHPHFTSGSVLIGDESADERRGEVLVGGGKQYNGRLGKVDLSQVGVFLSLAKDGKHNWLDGELFLPEVWFNEAHRELRERLGVPKERHFQTKLELFWQMVQRSQGEGVAFDAVAVDGFYGQSFWLRQQLDQANIEFYADVPANTKVYLSEPVIGMPQNRRGPKAKKPKVLSPLAYRVENLRDHPSVLWQSLTLRPTERGWLTAAFARIPVWTVQEESLTVTKQWLLMRRQGKKVSYTFSNAAADTSLQTMALRKSQRYFIERDNQEAKSEFGWDEIQTTTFLAWQHQLAFTILAQWFITQTRLDWEERIDRDPQLLDQYEVSLLPALSVANVRELLRAALPLPTLSPLDAASLVVEHLDNRTRSRKSRLLNRSGP
jgi:SRSO17 transposase